MSTLFDINRLLKIQDFAKRVFCNRLQSDLKFFVAFVAICQRNFGKRKFLFHQSNKYFKIPIKIGLNLSDNFLKKLHFYSIINNH
jgi:hypothetical protein